MTDVRCECGKLEMQVELDPKRDSHVVCYCDDCRAYMRWLGRDAQLDAHGGTEVVQVAPAEARITRGQEHLACVRLSPKGLLRFYAKCCRSPLGNTMRGVPFVGLSVTGLTIPLTSRPEGVNARFALNGKPPGASDRASLGVVARTARQFASRLARGQLHPSPFLDEKNEPRATPEILTRAERDALRAREMAG
jgi:hypothetical protein